MPNRNRCFFDGHIGKAPDFHEYGDGKLLGKVSMAVNDGWGDNKKTYWADLVFFDPLSKWLADKNLDKGDILSVECRISPNNFEDKDGNKRYGVQFIVDNYTAIKKQGSGQDDDLPY